MILRLYRNCILNSSYSEVFRTRELVESYLGSLTSVEIIDDETIYPRKRDIIHLDYTEDLFSQYTNIYNANYITIENDSLLNLPKLYAFIDSVDISNGIITLEYSEDSWTQYLPYWTVRNALLTNCLRVDEYEVADYEVPIPYASQHQAIRHTYETPITSCNLLVELQLYKQQSFLESPSNAVILKGIIGYITAGTGTEYGFNFAFTQYDALNHYGLYGIVNEISNASNRTITYNGETWKYNLINCYIFRNIDKSKFRETQFAVNIFKDGNINFDLLQVLNDVREITLKTGIISYNRYNLNFGFMTHRFPLINNGRDLTYDIYLETASSHFAFYIKYQNVFEDITEDFKFSPDFSYIDASSFQQRKISGEIQLLSGVLGMALGGVGVGTGVAGISDALTPIAYKGINMTPVYNENRMGTSVFHTASGISSMISNAGNMAKILASQYNNSQLSNNKFQNSIINVYYGVCRFEVNNTESNIDEVNELLDEVGYNVNKIITNIKTSLTSVSTKYDIIRVEFIRLNGVNTEINNIIETILKNGTKIWYSTDVG